MSRNGSSSSSSFLFPNNIKNISAEGEFLRSKELMGGSDLFGNQQNQEQCCGLARYRTAPGSFLATLLETTTDNNSSSGGDDSEALFSAFMDNGNLDLNQMQCSMKQEIGGESGYVGSYSVGMESHVHKMNNNGSNLARLSSSPAGFFSGFGSMGGVGNYRIPNHAESNSSRGMNSQINFSSPPSSTSRFMPTIPEKSNESIVTRSSENKQSIDSTRVIDSREYEPWNDDSFSGLKRTRDGDLKMFSGFDGLENQNEETRKKTTGLVHHLSLPNSTSAKMTEIQKFLHFQQDTVPCQIRAKRGFATHPRSIAERMRRTRISEKMKKLQDLFPNMDKQTNTSDMLDLAVEYIKDLQKQVKTLTDTRARCVCSRGTYTTKTAT